jgi:hypothetical protein
VKRSKPLSRGKGLSRKSELKADVEKVREFMQRGRQDLQRSAKKSARSGFRRWTEAEGPLTPGEWRKHAFEASGGRCIITGARALDADDPRFQAHHLLPKRTLRSRGLFAFVWDPRNAVWLSNIAHELLEKRSVHLRYSRLPVTVWGFCRELDALEGTQWATELVRRAYPISR